METDFGKKTLVRVPILAPAVSFVLDPNLPPLGPILFIHSFSVFFITAAIGKFPFPITFLHIAPLFRTSIFLLLALFKQPLSLSLYIANLLS